MFATKYESTGRQEPRLQPGAARPRSAALLTLLLVPGALALASLAADDLPRLGRIAARVDLAISGASYLGRDGVILQSTLMDCGPAALANLIRVLGMDAPSTDSLMVLAGTGPTGTRASGLIRAAEDFGLSMALERVTLAGLPDTALPFIAWVKRSHFVTVTERTPSGRLTVVDPQVGRYSISEDAFKTIWSGEAILLAEPHQITRDEIRHGPESSPFSGGENETIAY